MKRTLLAAAGFLMAVSLCTPAQAAWESHTHGWKYKTEDGSYAAGRTMDIGGASYLFDGEGYIKTGWQSIDGYWYYYDTSSGAMAKGWVQDGGKWYYMNPDTGIMMTGFVKVGNKKYYLDKSSGAMADNAYVEVDGNTYLAQSGGQIWTSAAKTVGSVTLRADEEGILYERNNITRAVDKTEWYPFSKYGSMSYDAIDNYNNLVNARMAARYEKYVEDVKSASYTKRETKLKNWEKKTISALNKLGVLEVDINKYINDVENGHYDSENDTYYKTDIAPEGYYDDYDDDEYYDDEYYDDDDED